MSKSTKPPVRREDLNKVMLQVLIDVGIDPKQARRCHKDICHRFLERMVVAFFDRQRVQLRGLMKGKMDKRSRIKMNIQLTSPIIREENRDDGFDFEHAING